MCPRASEEAAGSLAKSSLPFDVIPLKALHDRGARGQEVWVDANWQEVGAVL